MNYAEEQLEYAQQKLNNAKKIIREDWKLAVTTPPSQRKMYNWRAYEMLEYIRHMIEDGKLSRDIFEVITKYEDWIMMEVDD